MAIDFPSRVVEVGNHRYAAALDRMREVDEDKEDGD